MRSTTLTMGFITQGRANNLVLGRSGVKFRLTDHFHLPHYVQAMPIKVWAGLTLLGSIARLIVVLADSLARSAQSSC